MAEIKGWFVEQLQIPEGCNIILGQSHFIKTVEDLYEALVTASPSLEFGIAFCEASPPCLIRRDGNAPDLVQAAVQNAMQLRTGHTFIVLLRKGYPINVLDRIKAVQEVCRVDAATANPPRSSAPSISRRTGTSASAPASTPTPSWTASYTTRRRSTWAIPT